MYTFNEVLAVEFLDLFVDVELFELVSTEGNEPCEVEIVINIKLVSFPHQNFYVFRLKSL